MIGDHDRDLDAIDRGLQQLFSESPNPGDLTAHVLRRIEEERWQRESRLDRIFYTWLCAAGTLMLAAMAIAVRVVAGAVGS
jgi:hypothetical protein